MSLFPLITSATGILPSYCNLRGDQSCCGRVPPLLKILSTFIRYGAALCDLGGGVWLDKKLSSPSPVESHSCATFPHRLWTKDFWCAVLPTLESAASITAARLFSAFPSSRLFPSLPTRCCSERKIVQSVLFSTSGTAARQGEEENNLPA